MKYLLNSFLILIFLPLCSLAWGADFSGVWEIDLRTKEQIKNNADCGRAYFELNQLQDNTIVGYHTFYTVDCGRLNEGGPVEGTVKGSTAILYVTSGRNNEQVKGKAVLKKGELHWIVLEQTIPGEYGGDGLILGKGVLKRISK